MKNIMNVPDLISIDDVVKGVENIVGEIKNNNKDVNISIITNTYKKNMGAVSMVLRFDKNDDVLGIPSYQKQDLLVFIVRNYKFALYQVIISNDSTNGLDVLYTNLDQNPVIPLKKYLPQIASSTIEILTRFYK